MLKTDWIRHLLKTLGFGIFFILIAGLADISLCRASGEHFAEPLPSLVFCDFLGTLKIDGVDAQPGDEIAFYDPNNVLCGLYKVETAGQYGIVHVYGDDPSTPTIDEGALDGEMLTVIIWDASSGVELPNTQLQLVPGIPSVGTSFAASSVPPVWQDRQGFALNIDTVSYFGSPSPSPYVCNYIGNIDILGEPAQPGDEIGIFNSSDVLCGAYRITITGQYGIVQVYGDDPATTSVVEGAAEGETLTFKIWDKSTGLEKIALITVGMGMGSFIPASIPPFWSNETGYALDLELISDNVLTVSLNGSGTGTVTSSEALPLIDCGSDCSEAYTEGTHVTLTATPGEDSFFTGWSTAECPGTDPCELTMDTAKHVIATFEPFLWQYDAGISFSRQVMPDINGDGFDDLLLLTDDEWVKMISGADSATEFWSYQVSGADRSRRGLVVISDLDGDGIDDIIVTLGTSGNNYGQNANDDEMVAISGAVTPPGARLIWGPVHIGCGLRYPIILPDVNGDGIEDIFATTMTPSCSGSGDAGYHFSGADGSLIWNFTIYAEGDIWDIYGTAGVPDLNNDGLADIIVSGAGGSDGVEAWKGGPVKGQIWRALTGTPVIKPYAVADMTGDGIAEIAAATFNAAPLKLIVLNGTTGSTVWEFTMGNTVSSLADIGDVNGDTIKDVAIGTCYLNNVDGTDYHVYALNGNPSAGSRIIWSVDLAGLNNYVYETPDIDGDQIKDVLVMMTGGKLMALSGVDGSRIWEKQYPGAAGGIQLGEFNGATGMDYISSMGTSIVASETGSTLDINPPVLTVPGPATVEATGTLTPVDIGMATAVDPEDGPLTPVADNPGPYPVGTTMITWNVTDFSGNTATGTQEITVTDTTLPTITILGDNPVTVPFSTVYTDAGATATDLVDGTVAVTETGNTVNTGTVGTYAVTYSATDTDGNTATATRTVKVVDQTPPVIQLIGNSSVTIDQYTTYTDAGATASDNVDGNLTGAIVTVNPVNISIPRTYTVTYDVTDAAGNPAVQVFRTVTVNLVDIDPPVLTVPGPVTVEATGPATPVNMGVATAFDQIDGPLTPVVDNPGPFPVGTATVTWSATDSSGNTGTEIQHVIVTDTTPPTITILGNNPETVDLDGTYTDAGATAQDLVDGAVAVSVADNNVNNAIAGTYAVIYSTEDQHENTATATRQVIVANQTADLEILKIGTSQFVDPGNIVSYIITVTNHGPANAENVTVTDILPAGIKTLEYATDGNNWGNWPGTKNFGNLVPEGFIQIKLRGTVAANATVKITNTAMVDSDQTDGHPGDNSSSYQILIRKKNTPPLPMSPAEGAIIDPGKYPVVLESSPFVDPDGHTHVATYWRVRRSDMPYNIETYHESFNNRVTDGDMTHHAITGGLLEGMAYYWQVGYVDSGSDAIFWSTERHFTVGVTDTSEIQKVEPGVTIKGYRMVSIDYIPEIANCFSVFGVHADNAAHFRIGTYDPLTSSYIGCMDDLKIKPGRSYWVLARHGLKISVEGIPMSTAMDVEAPLQFNEKSGNGWNMIGVPNGRDYLWENLQVVQYDDDGTIIDGPYPTPHILASRLIDNKIWVWDKNGYTAHEPGENPSFKLVHQEGFWVKALDKGVSLIFSVDAQQKTATLNIRQWMPSLYKYASQWIKRSFMVKTAHADDDDSPPMPMGNLETITTGSDSRGCFIDTSAKKP